MTKKSRQSSHLTVNLTVSSFKISLAIQFIQSWKWTEFICLVCLDIKRHQLRLFSIFLIIFKKWLDPSAYMSGQNALNPSSLYWRLTDDDMSSESGRWRCCSASWTQQHPEQSAPFVRCSVQAGGQAGICLWGWEGAGRWYLAPPWWEFRFPVAALLVALRMYGDGEGTVWDRVGRPHRDCMCYLGPPTTLMPM